MRLTKQRLLPFLVLTMMGGTGCELIATIDRGKIPTETGTGGTTGGGGTGGVTTTSGTGGVTGGGGTGGVTGGGGTGGTGGTTTSSSSSTGTECTVLDDCPKPPNECVTATCDNGFCGTSNVANHTATTTQTDADCKRNECDGNGAVVVVNDDSDLPDDANACTADTCNSGAPKFTNLGSGTVCGTNLVCDGNGACVGCVADGECPAGNDCQVPKCNSGTCGFTPAAPHDLPAAKQTAHDCQKLTCDGMAQAPLSVADNTDTPVDDGNACTQDTCTAGAPAHPAVTNGTTCDDGNANTAGDVCTNGVCAGVDHCVGVTCPAPAACHVAGVCDHATGNCSTPNAPNGTACDDGNANTAGDVCTGGVCAGVDHCIGVTCPAPAACHLAGVCDHATGNCSNPTAANGASCDDGNASTAGDVCTNGVCAGTDHCIGVTCPAPAACHVAGVCDHATGTCSTPNAPNGTACDDGNANTAGDVCTGGVCAGVDHCIGVTCPAPAACHVAGVCDHATGNCSTPNAPNGTSCDDGNADTTSDQCTNGVCAGTDLCAGKTCTALDQCHVAGACDHATGTCSNPNAPNGTTCDDGNPATLNETCQNGLCGSVDLCAGKTCTALDQCHVAGVCAPATGICSNPNANNGTACNDGNANTANDVCTGGVCAGVDLCLGVTCPAPAACHLAGVCDHATGNCSNPTAPDTTACDDGNANTTGDQCTGGVCAGVDLCLGVTCPAPAACHLAGVCDHATGNCSNPTAPDTTACDDGNANTTGDQCTGGVCAGVDHCVGVVCTALDVCHDVGTCTDHATGACSNPPSAPGTSCGTGGPVCDGNGNCVAPLTVTVTPAESANVLASTVITATFSSAMTQTTVTAQAAAGACSGSVQVSLDDFTSCIAFPAAATWSGNTATFVAAPGLLVNRTYKIRVTTAATAISTATLASTFTQASGWKTIDPKNIVLSEVYGGSGTGTATYTSDYVVIHNRGQVAVDLTGWSVQYASSTGTSWQVAPLVTTAKPTPTVAPGAYFLFQLSTGSGVAALPLTPDAISNVSIAMSGTNAKVALAASTTALTGSCPANVVDFVGYGTANCFEGTAAVAALSTTASALRKVNGCTDTNANSTDFTVGAPSPKNGASAAVTCALTLPTLNETGSSPPYTDEADYVVVQSPKSYTGTTGTSLTVYGQIYDTDTNNVKITGGGTAIASLSAQLGYAAANADGTAKTNPEWESGWTWVAATYNTTCGSCGGSNDEYQATFNLPPVGKYVYVFRFSLDGGQSWTYADADGAGSNSGLSFDLTSLATLTSN